MAFYAKFQLKPGADGKERPVRKFGVPESVPLRGNVSRAVTDPETAAEVALTNLRGTDLALLEIYRDDGTLAKKVV